MTLNEWHERSFLIELKPRARFANVFIDCPPVQQSHYDENLPSKRDLVKLTEHGLEMDGHVDEHCHQQQQRQCFSVDFLDLCLFPNTVCGLTWADHRRLFMCKVHAKLEGLPLVAKNFHRLKKDIHGSCSLNEYAREARKLSLNIDCIRCKNTLFNDNEGTVEVVPMTGDLDWHCSSPSLDYFCCRSNGHFIENRPFLPSSNPKRVLLTDSLAIVKNDCSIGDSLRVEEKCDKDNRNCPVICVGCKADVGRTLRTNQSVFELYHSVCTFRVGDQTAPFLTQRFDCLERYYAFLLVSQCDAQGTLKLVVRSIDKRPYLLVWLLESYVMLTNGDLRESDEKPSSELQLDPDRKCDHPPQNWATHSFPAIKMLYKVFEAESAASDPRTQGQDASCGLLDQPHDSCVRLTEILLKSSHALPTACRSMGQFYVGFLKLNDCM